MSTALGRVWVGIAAGKSHDWAVAVNAEGETVFSRKGNNDETAILELIALACESAETATWAVDISGRSSALLLALLIAHGQQVFYIPGRTVNRMSGAYRGDGKTDWEDHRGRGVLRLAVPKDRSALCLVSDASAGWRTPLRGAGRVRCGLIGT